MKKLMLATFVLGALSSSAFAADQGSGEVKFTGTIITAPCSIAPGDESQTVPLGQISNVTLEKGNMSKPQPFSIKLEGCNLNATYVDAAGETQNYNNTLNVTFKGTEWMNGTTATGLLQIIGDGKNAGVQLMTASGNKIKLNEKSDDRSFIEGDNELKFSAALAGVKDLKVTPGQFDATTNFVLSYN
ncbi:fimbrial protein [Providencia sp. Me31A]|uniref:fimbrial protein n=1 Tax=Providencia sp. Me31A TaxID=3392637 RepID=UPI003D28EEEE